VSGYEVLPVRRFETGGGSSGAALEWVVPGVMALHRMLFLVDTHVQGLRLRDMMCRLQLPGVNVQATCAELETPAELQAIAGRYLVLPMAGRVVLLVPRRSTGMPVFEVSVLAIMKLPPPCFEPKGPES